MGLFYAMMSNNDRIHHLQDQRWSHRILLCSSVGDHQDSYETSCRDNSSAYLPSLAECSTVEFFLTVQFIGNKCILFTQIRTLRLRQIEGRVVKDR
mmetsp:Transcript_9229/g.56089  ORF Transcript_9229/g.56089 Transcript_9229/m.56089 type:complete len:96 (-) Transcript_9229:164-451(-)